MTICEQLRADAPGLAALPSRDPERAAAWAHAAGCPECARALREGERLQAALGEWQPAPLPAAALARAAQSIEAELVAEQRRRSSWSAAAAAALMAGLLAVSRHRAGSALDWTTAGALAAAALALAALAGRRPIVTLGAVAAAALAAVLVVGRPGTLALAGLECTASELATAAGVVAATWLALRGGTTALTRTTVAALAAAGALAGDAVLQVTCAAHEDGPHLLAFHVGGVLLAAAAGLLWRPGRPLAVQT